MFEYTACSADFTGVIHLKLYRTYVLLARPVEGQMLEQTTTAGLLVPMQDCTFLRGAWYRTDQHVSQAILKVDIFDFTWSEVK
jgi:hypothetical protein